tara:strand:+ start:305 stop:544 length:240 start_codon:yes stop_codon:yes gene_type:complete
MVEQVFGKKFFNFSVVIQHPAFVFKAKSLYLMESKKVRLDLFAFSNVLISTIFNSTFERFLGNNLLRLYGPFLSKKNIV